MIVIGIDPGTAITGYGVVLEESDGRLRCLDFGAIVTAPKTPMPARLSQLFHSLQEVLERHQPHSAAVEKLFFQRNVRTAIAVGQARGVALLALSEAKLPVSEYTPMEVKQAVTGYGGAEKRQIQHMVGALLELSDIPEPDDAADALAVAICHLHSARLKDLAG